MNKKFIILLLLLGIVFYFYDTAYCTFDDNYKLRIFYDYILINNPKFPNPNHVLLTENLTREDLFRLERLIISFDTREQIEKLAEIYILAHKHGGHSYLL